MSTQPQTRSSPVLSDPGKSSVALLWDRQSTLPLTTILADEDLVILLTPATVPSELDSSETSDPFEPLGRALATKHRWIRHVPYTKHNGITGTHVAFVKRAKVVIFVITTFSSVDGVSQPEFADIVREVCEDKPLITVACCDPQDHDIHEFGFSTLLRSPGFSLVDLEAIASLLMVEESVPPREALGSPIALHPRPLWSVQPWDCERDIAEIHILWLESLPRQFNLSRSALRMLLKRDGYAMHHIVRDPTSGDIVGFCGTFTTFADSSADRLIGSIAAIVVRSEFRGRGIGRILHDEAFGKLNKVRGVGRIQLGSTFPRLLYGLPTLLDSTGWFKNRGWTVNESVPGKGRTAVDWLWEFGESPVSTFSSAGLTFRSYQFSDYQQVLDIANRESEKRYCFGWYDQYAKILDSSQMGDILVGLEGKTLVATAITYIPNSVSPAAADLPWAGSVGSRIGGVSCICIKDDDPDMVNRRDSVMIRLLQMCRQTLSERGMSGMFIDAVKSDDKAFVSLGFRKWAEYKEVWREV
ncbi:Fc.00g052220.m01.CDS01 [Cosmosporella sp. VM-42]